MEGVYSNDQTLGEALFGIYQSIIHKMEQKRKEFPMIHHQESRDNLIAYLYAKEAMEESFIRALEDEGLSSLCGYESHVLSRLELLLRHLQPLLSVEEAARKMTRQQAEQLIAERANAAFGEARNERKTRIMVTLDEQMADQTEMVEKLLLCGMDIARINCAHHHPGVWKQIIDCVRQAESNLHTKLQWDKKCRIYMDLPGPKIRINRIVCGERPLKLSVPKDECGNVIQPLTGLVFAGELPVLDQRDLAFAIEVDAGEEFVLNRGEELSFKDMRGRRRTLKITEIINPMCAKVELSNTAYLQAGTVLRHCRYRLLAQSVAPIPFKVPIQKGTSLKIYFHEAHLQAADADDAIKVTTTLPRAFHNVRPDHRLYIDDGKIFAVVENVTTEYVEAKVVATGKKTRMLKEGAGINLPDSFIHLNVSSLTDRDLEYIPFISKHADIIGLSFVHSPKDIAKLHEALLQHGAQHTTVIAKIETRAALHNLARILLEGLKLSSFGVMIARGDLAIEVGFEHMSIVQREIVTLCQAAHIPVIWATQVLENLAKKGLPARAEISDVSLGRHAQCIMLNKGPYIVEAVEMLAKVLEKEEAHPRKREEIAAHYMAQYGMI
ncbi:pyruvate kinase [Anoxybacteroides tepidamans]|uniref:pyruvate kinase n=1 Tax=Anoxybacteroides tepidamans TaxID=265948 RepID=UPI000484757D|nr:pyruvate kinase [Anoxybacillus tepidamans]